LRKSVSSLPSERAPSQGVEAFIYPNLTKTQPSSTVRGLWHRQQITFRKRFCKTINKCYQENVQY